MTSSSRQPLSIPVVIVISCIIYHHGSFGQEDECDPGSRPFIVGQYDPVSLRCDSSTTIQLDFEGKDVTSIEVKVEPWVTVDAKNWRISGIGHGAGSCPTAPSTEPPSKGSLEDNEDGFEYEFDIVDSTQTTHYLRFWHSVQTDLGCTNLDRSIFTMKVTVTDPSRDPRNILVVAAAGILILSTVLSIVIRHRAMKSPSSSQRQTPENASKRTYFLPSSETANVPCVAKQHWQDSTHLGQSGHASPPTLSSAGSLTPNSMLSYLRSSDESVVAVEVDGMKLNFNEHVLYAKPSSYRWTQVSTTTDKNGHHRTHYHEMVNHLVRLVLSPEACVLLDLRDDHNVAPLAPLDVAAKNGGDSALYEGHDNAPCILLKVNSEKQGTRLLAEWGLAAMHEGRNSWFADVVCIQGLQDKTRVPLTAFPLVSATATSQKQYEDACVTITRAEFQDWAGLSARRGAVESNQFCPPFTREAAKRVIPDLARVWDSRMWARIHEIYPDEILEARRAASGSAIGVVLMVVGLGILASGIVGLSVGFSNNGGGPPAYFFPMPMAGFVTMIVSCGFMGYKAGKRAEAVSAARELWAKTANRDLRKFNETWMAETSMKVTVVHDPLNGLGTDLFALISLPLLDPRPSPAELAPPEYELEEVASDAPDAPPLPPPPAYDLHL